MILAALCLQAASLLAHPLYLEEERPEVRAAHNLLIRYDGAERLDEPVGRTREEALDLAAELALRIRQGAPFVRVAERYSEAFNARDGAVLGSFPPRLLDPPLDEFLYSAEIGDVSEPLIARGGVHVLQRIDSLAAVRQILIAGSDAEAEQRARAVLASLEAGADFAELAREHCADPQTAARGGDLGIFERGVRDRMLKAAAFQAAEGELFGPIQTPLGWHVLQRVPVEELDPSLRETTMVRAQGILVSYTGALGAPRTLNRLQSDALEFANAIHRDVLAGKPFEDAARDFNDDPGGKERGGDLGWIFRRNPDLPLFMDRLFLMRPGEMIEEPLSTAAGYVILRRAQ